MTLRLDLPGDELPHTPLHLGFFFLHGSFVVAWRLVDEISQFIRSSSGLQLLYDLHNVLARRVGANIKGERRRRRRRRRGSHVPARNGGHGPHGCSRCSSLLQTVRREARKVRRLCLQNTGRKEEKKREVTCMSFTDWKVRCSFSPLATSRLRRKSPGKEGEIA